MNVYASLCLTGLYYILYPIYFVVYLLALTANALLSPLANVLLFLLQPLILFSKLLGFCALAPFRFLQRFEVIYPITAPHHLY